MVSRYLASAEKNMIVRMLGHPVDLDHQIVMNMNDGGMGSLYFVSKTKVQRQLDTVLSEAAFIDEDGVVVIVTLNLDQNGDLFELDIWKVDYSPLVRWPSQDEITILASPVLS